MWVVDFSRTDAEVMKFDREFMINFHNSPLGLRIKESLAPIAADILFWLFAIKNLKLFPAKKDGSEKRETEDGICFGPML